MLNDIKVARTYPYPPEAVWSALTDSDALASWFLPNDFRAEVGHAFTFQDKPAPGFDGTIRCRVLAVDQTNHRLVYSWQGGSIDTEVEFRLSPTPAGGTRLELEHRGFSGLVNKLFVRNLLAAGWRKKLLAIKLPQYLAARA